ncbi:MAG TPA: FAD-dependent oxidoreductase [Myxococcaceae bacterium]|nr:FAD-dependent oxidoreductase [Myxococcaceae bacterium]
MKAEHHRVIVVGAGPAGCATAIACRQRGLEVLLLERASFPRHRPGETLHPGVEPILEELGVGAAVRGAGFPRHTAVRLETEAGSRLMAYGADASGPWRGFQAWRPDFDALLLSRAREVGVDVLMPCAADGLLVEEGRVRGVKTAAGTHLARWVVDAGGSAHWLARRRELPLNVLSPRLVARYGYCRGQVEEAAEFPLLRLHPKGWTWMATVKPGLLAWVKLGFAPEPSPVSRERAPVSLPGVGRVRGANVTWRLANETAGPGFFLAGDSGGVLDPGSSHGVLRALMSGMLAAHLMAGVARALLDEAEAIERYRGWFAGTLQRDAERLRELYGAAVMLSPRSREGTSA